MIGSPPRAVLDKIEAMKLRLQLVFILAFFAMAFGATSLQAQTIPGGAGLEIISSTDSPTPGQKVTLRAQSYGMDLNSANITWVAGGKTLAKGIGETTIMVDAPAMGKRTTINLTVVTLDGDTHYASLVLASASIDLIIESDGYVPSGFSGKAPVVYQNNVRIIAIPHIVNSSGVEYDPSTLIYNWEQGTSAIQGASGYGKQSVMIPSQVIPRPYTITVNVTSRDGFAHGSGIVAVNPGGPTLNFYRNDPLYGPLFNTEMGRVIYLGTQRETGIIAVPYGFNLPETGVGGATLSWFINGQSHADLAGNRTVTLRAPEGQSGTTNIDLSITNQNDIMQKVDGGFSVVFSGSNQ